MSPRPGPRRTSVTVRLSATEISQLETVAAAEGIRRSEALRRLQAYGYRNMPGLRHRQQLTPTRVEDRKSLVVVEAGDRVIVNIIKGEVPPNSGELTDVHADLLAHCSIDRAVFVDWLQGQLAHWSQDRTDD